MILITLDQHNVEFFIEEGHLCEVNTEDGIGYYPESWVGIIIDNIAYINEHRFLAKYIETGSEDGDLILMDTKQLCTSFISKIKERGCIDLSNWVKYNPEPYNLEQEWLVDWEMERLEFS